MSGTGESQVLLLKQRMMLLQIIHVALLAGVAIFGIVVFAIASGDPPARTPLISYVAVGAVAGTLVMSSVVASLVARELVKQKFSAVDPSGRRPRLGTFLVPLCEVYTTRHIIRMAMLEGTAFFCMVSYMLEQRWWSLAVAGALWVWMLWLFPTLGRVELWCRTQFENWTLTQP